MMTLTEIENEVKQLPREQQMTLITDILQAGESDAEMAWYKEAAKRREELMSGKVEGIPAQQALDDIRTELHN